MVQIGNIKINETQHMTNKEYSIINKHYDGESTYMNDFKKQYESEDKDVLKKVIKETEVMILNNQLNDTN